MPETILITGATSSLATRIVHLLLTKYSTSPQDPSLDEKDHEYTLLLTSQNPSKIKLRLPRLTSNTNISIRTRKLDLSNLSSVHEFATAISTDVQSGKIPQLSSIICNASFWDLRGDGELTDDGHEKTFQINYIAHTALVLRLLGSFNPGSGGKIVLLTCDAHRHWPLKSVLGRTHGLEKYPPGIPADLNELVEVESQSHSQSEPQSPEQILEELQEKPKIRKNENMEYMPRGIQRYANSKIALTMWMYALNRRLEAVRLLFPISPFSLLSLLPD
jgi:NAD(P)-dependent dehydrogenase (short-subunit alcohol dehydrogenase family)